MNKKIVNIELKMAEKSAVLHLDYFYTFELRSLKSSIYKTNNNWREIFKPIEGVHMILDKRFKEEYKDVHDALLNREKISCIDINYDDQSIKRISPPFVPRISVDGQNLLQAVKALEDGRLVICIDEHAENKVERPYNFCCDEGYKLIGGED